LVADILVSIGNDSVQPLISLFQKSDLSLKTLARTIRIIGRISSESAQSFLFGKLNYPNKWIVLEVVNALNEEKFKFAFGNYSLVDKAIFNTIGAAAWLLAMDVSLHGFGRNIPVKRALVEEYNVTIDLLFKLLQLKHSDGVIQEARKHLMGNSANEQRELSVEMLGSLIEKEIKDYLFPLLHNNRKREKVRQLQTFFPIGLKEPIAALREIINTDLGHVSLWTKACALKAYIESQDDSISEDIYAQVFNPDPLLSEIAFFGIYKWKNQVPNELFDRLSNRMKKRLTSILSNGEHFEYQMLFNKVLCLQNISYFEKVKGHYLIPLAEILIEHQLDKGESLFIQCSDEEVLPVFMVPVGDVSLSDMHKRQFKINRNFLYGLGLYAGGITLNAYSRAVIYIAKPEQIGSLVLNHEELSETLHKYIQNSNFY
jgi:AAA family ATP:ADP antiporter